MLDENLPAFFLKPSTAGIKHHRSFYLSQHGSDPAPAYTLQYADPDSPSPTHKNCYAAALFDAYNPEVLFGEVLARPGWTQPTLSQEEIRKNGGISPPPQPIMPSDFVVQLYNPDQQIQVQLKEGKWGGSDSWEFSMPEEVFRTPSASVLDHGQSDPASLATTPRIIFQWRKESKLNKDLTCYMTGKSTDKKKKSSRKDPDITVALWRQMHELTIYEPNLSRVELEDPKGLEVVLLLSAVVIKDLFYSNKEHMREIFNITEVSGGKLSAGGRKLSNPKSTSNLLVNQPTNNLANQTLSNQGQSRNDLRRNSLPKLQTTPPGSSSSRPPPMADPRAQWELDAETARLKAQAQAEARAAERQRQEREKADELERRRLQKMIQDEEREAQHKQAEIDRETERLRKLYGVTPIPGVQSPPQPAQANSSSSRLRPQPLPPRPSIGSNGLYVQSSASATNVVMSGGSGSGNPGSLNVGGAQQKPAKKKSFFGLRSVSDDASDQRRLAKKGSAMW